MSIPSLTKSASRSEVATRTSISPWSRRNRNSLGMSHLAANESIVLTLTIPEVVRQLPRLPLRGALGCRESRPQRMRRLGQPNRAAPPYHQLHAEVILRLRMARLTAPWVTCSSSAAARRVAAKIAPVVRRRGRVPERWPP